MARRVAAGSPGSDPQRFPPIGTVSKQDITHSDGISGPGDITIRQFVVTPFPFPPGEEDASARDRRENADREPEVECHHP